MLSKKIVIAWKFSAAIELLSALVALGAGSNPVATICYSSKSQLIINYTKKSLPPKCAHNLEIYDANYQLFEIIYCDIRIWN